MKKVSCLIFSLVFILICSTYVESKIFVKDVELVDIIVFNDFKYKNLKDEFLTQVGIDTDYVTIFKNNQKVTEDNYKKIVNEFENVLTYEYRDIFGKKVVKDRTVYIFSENEFQKSVNINSKYKIKNVSVDTVYNDTSANRIFVGKVLTEPKFQENKDCYILKLNRNNKIIWGKMFENLKINRFNKIINISDDEYCLIASVYRNSEWTDGLVAKFDKDGNFIWDNCYGSSHIDDFKDVVALNNGEIIILAEVSNGDGDVKVPITINNPLNMDLVLLKYDVDGNIIWQSSISNKNDLMALKIMNDESRLIVFGEVFENLDGKIVRNLIISGFDMDGKRKFSTVVNSPKEFDYNFAIWFSWNKF